MAGKAATGSGRAEPERARDKIENSDANQRVSLLKGDLIREHEPVEQIATVRS
jgi:hypothetical protein